MAYHTYHHTEPFALECGKQLADLQIAYYTYGELNAQKDNVVWVCHALTANSDVFEWWAGLFGQEDLFNPKDHFIVCANVLSSPYGSTNPLSINPENGKPYYLDFPELTIRDLVAAHQVLAKALGINDIHILIGGSLGGQQALEWAISDPEKIKNLILVATNAAHSPWGIAFNESQRLAIRADKSFYSSSPNGGKEGLKAARSIALLSYRNYGVYGNTQREDDRNKTTDFKATSYQQYQGEKLVKRFNAYSYYYLSKTMDSHQVGRNRESIELALQQVKAKTLIIGILSDLLFPIAEQQFLAEHIAQAEFAAIDSVYGHDGFLIETALIDRLISKFLNV